ncbi:hypothetical protein [Arenimonas sp. MALMAid1274]|uniref:hypothetical protein n=1 Tax=Arenimonas sp. MALMAid1274 TaxID=3411630 RepID=UPI003B9E7B8F
MAQVELSSWPASGLFPVQATGSHATHEPLASIAANAKGETGLCFLPVALYPYDTNPYDPNAVGVMALPSMGAHLLGHLPRELAVAYRQRMAALGMPHFSACDAVISGGMKDGDKQYNYVLELDLDLAAVPTAEPQLTRYAAERVPAQTGPLDDAGPGYVFRAWLPQGGLGALCSKRSMHSWSAPGWKTVNYYVLSDRRIGLGHKLVSIPKGMHRKWFGAGVANATLVQLDGRWATVRLEKGEPGNKAKWQLPKPTSTETYSPRLDIDYS